MTKANLMDIYYILYNQLDMDNRASDRGVYCAEYDDGSILMLDQISELGYHDFLEDIHNCIDRKDMEKVTLMRKYKSEIKKLQKINHKMRLELQRLQQFEEENFELKKKLKELGEYSGDLL